MYVVFLKIGVIYDSIYTLIPDRPSSVGISVV